MSIHQCVICEKKTLEKIIPFTLHTLDKAKAVLDFRVNKEIIRKQKHKYTFVRLPDTYLDNGGYHRQCYKLFTAIKLPNDVKLKLIKSEKKSRKLFKDQQFKNEPCFEENVPNPEEEYFNTTISTKLSDPNTVEFSDPTDTGLSDPTHAGLSDPTHAGLSDPTHARLSDPTHAGLTDPTHAGLSDPTHAGLSDPNNYKVMEIVKIEHNIICHGCLSENREIYTLGEYYDFFVSLIGEQKHAEYSGEDMKFCWECIAKLKKFHYFQAQLVQAQNAMMELYYERTIPPTLSKLKTVKLDNIDVKTTMTNEITQETNENEEVDTKFIKNEIYVNPDEMQTENALEISDNFNSDSDYFNENVNEKESKDVNLIDCIQDGTENDAKIKLEEEMTVKKKNRNYSRKTITKHATLVDNFEKVDDNIIKSNYTMLTFSEEQIEEHILVNERYSADINKYRYSCKSCNLGYRNPRDFVRHNDLNHHKFNEFYCSLCNITLNSKEELKEHWREHTPVAKCNICGIYLKPMGMRQHLNLSHVKKYKCNLCNNVIFETLKQFIRHYKETHMRLICDYCSKVFKNKDSMANHIRKFHTPYPCPECKITLQTEQTFTQHVKRTHPEKLNINVKEELRFCVECDKSFASEVMYADHLKYSIKHGGKQPKRVACPECGKVFFKGSYMRNHYNLHHLKKTKHYCQSCDKYFARPDGLKKHINFVHLKLQVERNKMCDLCGKGFTSNRIMKNHRATHTGERPHKCLYCEATFIQKYAMQTHMRTQHKHV